MELLPKSARNIGGIVQKKGVDGDVQKQTPEPVDNTTIDIIQELSA